MSFDPASPQPASPLPPEGGERWTHARFRHHHHHHHHHRGHGVIPGLVLVAWGALLLLRETGHLDPALRAFDFWPLVLIGLGLSIALHRRRFGKAIVGLAVAALGAGLLAEKLGYVVGIASYWPVLLIAVGVGIIWNGFGRRRFPRFDGMNHAREQASGDELHRSVSMGGLAVAVDSQQFRGGSLHVTMGELKADLRRAAIAGDQAVLELSLTMAGVELYLPSNWQVVDEVSPFMGVVEDKTEPRPDAAGVQKRLVLRGALTMGAVNIHN